MKRNTGLIKADAEEQLQFSSFYLGGTLYGININHVQEINEDLNITKVPLAPGYVTGIMNLRGQIITVINLATKIGLSPAEITTESRVIIAVSKGEYIGLLVDQVADVVTVSKSDVANSPANIKGVQGKFFEGLLQIETQELMALLNMQAVLELH